MPHHREGPGSYGTEPPQVCADSAENNTQENDQEKIELVRYELSDTYPDLWKIGLLPVSPGGKDPIGAGWNAEASLRFATAAAIERIEDETERTRARHAFEETQALRVARLAQHVAEGGNIGMALPPGVLVIDADDADSVAVIDRVLPDAPKQRTMKGAHYFVRAPEGEISQRSKVVLEPGVQADLRVAGKGQVVVVPSRHPDANGEDPGYRWEGPGLTVSLDELEPVPARWLPAIQPPQPPEQSTDNPSEQEPKERVPDRGDSDLRFTKGKQHSQLVKMAGRMRRAGLTPEEIEAALQVANRDRCEEPGTSDAIRKIAHSSEKWERGRLADQSDAAARGRPNLIQLGRPQLMKPRRALIQGVVHPGEIAWIAGNDGTHKTGTLIEMGSCMGREAPFRGQATIRGGSLLWSGEGYGGINDRVIARGIHDGVNGDVPFFVNAEDLDLLEKSHIERVLEVAEEIISTIDVPLRTVMFDTFATLVSGDENENRTANQFYRSIRALIRELTAMQDLPVDEQVAVWNSHHFGKDMGKGLRGASALTANADVILFSKEIFGGTDLASERFEVTFRKNKDGDKSQRFQHVGVREVVGVHPDTGLPIHSVVTVGVGGEAESEPKERASQVLRPVKGKWVDRLFAGIETFSDGHGLQIIPDEIVRQSGLYGRMKDVGQTPGPGQFMGVKRELLLKHMVAMYGDADAEGTIRKGLDRALDSSRLPKNEDSITGYTWSYDGWVWCL